MFTALRENGTIIYLFPRLPRSELMKERESGKFFCPECKEELMLKMGSVKVEHFAHMRGSSCVDSYEKESEYHLNGKLQLLNWLEGQKLNPKMEPYYKSIRQRPDIGINQGNTNYVLEFQCSTIPPDLMIKRTKNYRRNNYFPIWLLGGKNIKRKGQNKVSLSNFDYLFLSKTTSGSWYLPAYCSSTHQFILLTNITPIGTRNVLAHLSIIPSHHHSFRKLLEPDTYPFFSPEVWRKEVHSLKENLLIHGNHSPYLKELYNCSMNISLLPPFIGLPVTHAPIIETAPLIWQSYIFIDHFKNDKDIITFGEVYRSFMKRVSKKQIVLRPLPLVQNLTPTIPLFEFLQKMVQLDVLEIVNQNTYNIKKKVELPEHIIQQQVMEKRFYTDYGDCLFST